MNCRRDLKSSLDSDPASADGSAIPMSQSQVVHIHGRIVLGAGHEVGDIWIADGLLSLTKPAGRNVDIHHVAGFAVPGLVDVHCHIGLNLAGAASAAETEQQALVVRDSGVLLIRDAGSPSDTRWVHGRDDLPKLLRSGHHLARPKRYLRGYARELADVSELPAVVAEEAADGDGWVKLIADWIDRDHGDLAPLWPDDLLVAAVAEAHAQSARVTAHTFSTEAIDGLLAAGIDCLEHGTGLTDRQIDEVAKRGIAVTPTLLQIGMFENIAAQGEVKYPVFAARMRQMYARRYDHVRALHEAGVRLLVGTDAGGTIRHGQIAAECAEMVRAGIPAAEVVAAASWRTREYLGVGDLVEGASVDLVVYGGDPRVDIRELATPKVIVLRGEVVFTS